MSKTKRTTPSRTLLIIVAVVGLIVVAGVGGFAAFIISSGSGEASVDIANVAPTLNESGEGRVYSIDPQNSEARFIIDEVLNGQPTTVVGTTSQLGGEIRVNQANPAESEIGPVVINARTLETDRPQRNRALRSFILLSAQDQYEFIRFEPTALSGLPDAAVEVGQTLEFQVTGDLSIVDTTQPVTFDAAVTLNADGTLTGTAQTSVQYADFGLTIPNVPQVASVGDTVQLELDFTAAEVR